MQYPYIKLDAYAIVGRRDMLTSSQQLPLSPWPTVTVLARKSNRNVYIFFSSNKEHINRNLALLYGENHKTDEGKNTEL
jgi:hypothetical protein